MERRRAVRISRLLSFGLRHQPAALGLSLDAQGWTDVSGLLDALRAGGEEVSREELAEIVRRSDKQRFALSGDGQRIRANQGHSIDVDLGLEPREPPQRLYHGTVSRFVDAIRRDGLVRGARTHVHLSADVATAEQVASRRAGARVVIVVRAAEMHADGVLFFRSENGVWLTAHVPPRYLEL
jgi:putative RNA 2'-phosphotransferase